VTSGTFGPALKEPVKAKVPMIILGLACVGLLLIQHQRGVEHQRALEQQRQSTEHIFNLSNSLAQASDQLAEQQKTNLVLQTNLSVRSEELKCASDDLVAVRQTLDQTQTAAKAADQRAQEAQEVLAKREERITGLETEKDDLTKRMVELNSSITELETKIADTEQKLAKSEGEREFLLAELKRLEGEKFALERKFDDLAALRAQMRKVRDEVAVARRLDWIRRGINGIDMKGAEKLQKGFSVPVASATTYSLDVDLTRQAK